MFASPDGIDEVMRAVSVKIWLTFSGFDGHKCRFNRGKRWRALATLGLVMCKDVSQHGTPYNNNALRSTQVFAKADPRVAQFYETGLVPKELWGFGEDLRKKFHTTKSVLLQVPSRI